MKAAVISRSSAERISVSISSIEPVSRYVAYRTLLRGGVVERTLDPRDQGIDVGLLGLRTAGGRHEPSSQLPDDRLEQLRVLRHRRRGVELIEAEVAG